MRQTLCAVLCVGVGFSSWAQEASPTPTPSAPPVVKAEEDTSAVLTDDNRLLFGAERRELTQLEFFWAIGRSDLVARGQANASRRFVLGVVAGLVAGLGVGVGVTLLATAPDVTVGRCNTDNVYYNEVCVPAKSQHEVGGIASIASGLVVAGVLWSVAYWSRPEVFSPWELKQFIKEHNAKVAPSVTLQLSPAVGPGFEGLVARGTF
jgi:hypothetical protein